MRTAAYARYSSDLQREASLEDQLRNVHAYCRRQSWPDPVAYTDAAISGSSAVRPSYRRMLEAAQRREFDVLLIDDAYRLARDMIELPRVVRELKFAGIRVIGVSDGFDTEREGYKLEMGMRGIMGEAYIDTLAKNVHRGQTGRVLAGACAGGLPYGYRVTQTGQRAIDEAQAAIVRRIYAEFGAGCSPRQIASNLNREHVPAGHGGTWSHTAIYGDVKRGIGILANPMYAGRRIWNRSRKVRHPVTGNKLRQERPPSEWIITEHAELAIVDRGTWEAAQARIKGRSYAVSGKGAKVKHLLSGILRCQECGGPMVVVTRYAYGCSTNKDRGAAVCGNGLRVRIEAAESALLASVKRDLLSDEALQRFERTVRATLKDAEPDLGAARAAIAKAETVHENIMAALRAGIITPSTKAELVAAEAQLLRARAELTAMQGFKPTQLLPRLRDAWRDIVAKLETQNLPETRAVLEQLLGKVVVRKEGDSVFAEIDASSQIALVAGAGFERYLTHRVVQVPISMESRKGKRPRA